MPFKNGRVSLFYLQVRRIRAFRVYLTGKDVVGTSLRIVNFEADGDVDEGRALCNRALCRVSLGHVVAARRFESGNLGRRCGC